MTARERIIAAGLGTVIVVAGGVGVIRNSVIEPRRALVQEIADARAEREELEMQVAPATLVGDRWTRHTRHTLGPTIEAARLEFRNDIARLLEMNNLDDSLRISDKATITLKKGPEEGFTELPVSVSVTGGLDELVRFLKDFYQRPYIKRVDQLTVSASAAQQRLASDVAREQRDHQKDPYQRIVRDESLPLSISMTLTTLALPRVPGVSGERLLAVDLENPSDELLAHTARYVRAGDLDLYNRIGQENVFRVNYPPPPEPKERPKPPPPPKDTKPVVKNDEPPPPAPPVDPRKDAGNFTLVGTTAINGEPIAYVLDERSRIDPPLEYRVNEVVDDGRLVLIHPRGIVVRARDDGAQLVDWYYPVGANFMDRERLSRGAHPGVWEALQQVTRS